MSRTIRINNDMFEVVKYRGWEKLNLSAADKELIGELKVNNNEMLFNGDRWEVIDNTASDRVCPKCLGTGWRVIILRDADGNMVQIESDSRCSGCHAAEVAKEYLPVRYRWVDYRSLKPYPDTKVPVAHQQKLLDQIKNGELTGHSVLFGGPSRAGKTVLASALLTKMVAEYLDQDQYRNLPIYRVNADEWIDKHECWKHYDFNSDKRPDRPEPNLESVMHLPGNPYTPCPPETPPIIFLEEVDKFSATKTRIKALYTLLNKVFEAGGMIVATTNLTPDECRAEWPDWFYRRLVESSQDGQIRHFDLAKVAKRTGKGAK